MVCPICLSNYHPCMFYVISSSLLVINQPWVGFLLTVECTLDDTLLISHQRFHVKGNEMAGTWKISIWFGAGISWFLTITEYFILSLVHWQLPLVVCHHKKIIKTVPNHWISSHNWNIVKKMWFYFLVATVMIRRLLHETNDQDFIALSECWEIVG